MYGNAAIRLPSTGTRPQNERKRERIRSRCSCGACERRRIERTGTVFCGGNTSKPAWNRGLRCRKETSEAGEHGDGEDGWSSGKSEVGGSNRKRGWVFVGSWKIELRRAFCCRELLPIA
ncbi:hypothetical protein U1Q18_002208 [Sarracenia purpurea var. burkii]